MVARRIDLELVRVLACLGIVYFHSGVLAGVSSNLAYSGLAYFILITIFFVDRNKTAFSAAKAVARKVWPSFVFWSAVYIVLGVVIARKDLQSYLSLTTLVTGGSIHLWYLPFIVLAVAAATAAARLMQPRVLFVVTVVGYFGWLVSSIVWRDWIKGYPLPLPQYFHGAGAVLLALWLMSGAGLVRYLCLFASLVLCLLVTIEGEPGVGVVYSVMTLMGLLVVRKRDLMSELTQLRPTVIALSSLTFGIYLVHPLFLSVASRLGLGDMSLMPFVAFVGSAVFVQVFLLLMPIATHRLVKA